MGNVVRGRPRTELTVVDELAPAGVATGHEAQGRIGALRRDRSRPHREAHLRQFADITHACVDDEVERGLLHEGSDPS